MGYKFDNYQSTRINDKGEEELMANFTADITKETRYVDGIKTESVLTIEGKQMPRIDPNNPNAEREPITLPPIEVPADQFANMNWVTPNWGIQAVIMPGSGVKDDLRTAIQLKSRPQLQVIYKHLGWTTIDKQNAYLHAGGAITTKGNDQTVSVRLTPELERYWLTTDEPVEAGIRASLAIIGLTKSETTWPLLAATLTPLFGETDFGIHVTGRTGTFKSELMSLFQSHYGPGMDARHLPGSWSSTANALEAQAFYCKNAAFTIDDFVPQGTSWQVRAYQTNADKIIRAQGNQAGRARLTDTSNLQTTMFPRGIILSTGEDTPEGHSVRARLLILELTPGDIDTKTLTSAQTQRNLYTATTSALIKQIATYPQTKGTPQVLMIEGQPFQARVDQLRNGLISIGHSRTPSMLARLITTAEYFLQWCQHILKVISPAQAKTLRQEALDSIIAAGKRQQYYLEAANPTDMFTATVRNILASGLGHFRTITGGIPKNAEILGWLTENQYDEMPMYKSRGPCIGWIKWDTDDLYIDLTAGYNAIKKQAGSELTLTKQTLLKRLKDDGLLTRTDDARERNTVRITADGHPRQVIAMSATAVLDTKEKPTDTIDEGDIAEELEQSKPQNKVNKNAK